MKPFWWSTVLAALLPAPLFGQSLEDRVRGAPDGRVRLSFAARGGVCGQGSQGITILDGDRDGEWESDCEPGPVRVSLRMVGGRVREAETYVGGRWRAAPRHGTDLGLVPARQAADLLLTLAARASDEAGAELVTAGSLADSAVVWPRLVRMARDSGMGRETRRRAVFWLSQAAGERATRSLSSLVDDTGGDLEVRKHAVFALSQRPPDEGVPALIHIARSHRHPELREHALFWLGQSEDPRAVSLFEEILR